MHACSRLDKSTLRWQGNSQSVLLESIKAALRREEGLKLCDIWTKLNWLGVRRRFQAVLIRSSFMIWIQFQQRFWVNNWDFDLISIRIDLISIISDLILINIDQFRLIFWLKDRKRLSKCWLFNWKSRFISKKVENN